MSESRMLRRRQAIAKRRGVQPPKTLAERWEQDGIGDGSMGEPVEPEPPLDEDMLPPQRRP